MSILSRCFGVAATIVLATGAGAQDGLMAGFVPALSPGLAGTSPVQTAQSSPRTADPLRVSLPDAQARAAAAAKAAQLAKLSVLAAKYHREAVQADYFPKVSSDLFNLHFNKFLGQEFQLRSLNRTAFLPLVDKDQTFFMVTAVQPVTPLFKVHEAVRIARADERIAQAKAAAVASQVSADVERTYLALLIAQRELVAAQVKTKMLDAPVQLARFTPGQSSPDRQAAILEAAKATVTANSHVTELTQSLNTLMGLPLDTRLELNDPPPLIEEISSSGAPAQTVIDKNPEVVEAQQTLVKARAAARISKLEYVPDVAGLWGYSVQNAIPALPHDFSFVGFMASWTVFDSGKRERTIQERNTEVRMAEINLELVRAKVAAGSQKASLELQRTRRILDLTRKVVAMYRAMPVDYQTASLEGTASRAQAEIEMYQAELDYRMAYSQLKRAMEGAH
jgi:outer membrane protein TolC